MRRRQLQESSSTKKHAAAAVASGGGLRRRVCLKAAAVAAAASSSAYASSYFGCQVQWALLFPPTNYTEQGNCNTLKDNLILGLIRYMLLQKNCNRYLLVLLLELIS
jgi:hypothetical protein